MQMEIVNCFWDWMAQLSWRLFILMEKSNNPLCSLDKVLFPYFLRINILFASVGWFSEKVLVKSLYDKLQSSSTRDFLIVVFLYPSCVQVRMCFLDRFACMFLLHLRTLCGDPYVPMHWLSSVRVPAGGDQPECCSTYCSSLRPGECAECSPTSPTIPSVALWLALILSCSY